MRIKRWTWPGPTVPASEFGECSRRQLRYTHFSMNTMYLQRLDTPLTMEPLLDRLRPVQIAEF